MLMSLLPIWAAHSLSLEAKMEHLFEKVMLDDSFVTFPMSETLIRFSNTQFLTDIPTNSNFPSPPISVRLTTTEIILIVVGSALILTAVTVVLIVLCCGKGREVGTESDERWQDPLRYAIDSALMDA
jgi:hypothetical protein